MALDKTNIESSLSILPTHTCFDDCLDYIENLIKQPNSNKLAIIRRYQVVHGIYQITELENDLNTKGRPFAHGWVFDKVDKAAIQDGYLNGERLTYGISTKDFYSLFKIIDETRYNLNEVYRLNVLHNNFGPWKQKYINLCADKSSA